MSTHTLSLSCHCPIMFNVQWSMFNEETSGGYCSGVPPLPIPNREVKPACADGTAMQCGRVGSRRLFFKKSLELEITWGFFSYSPPLGRRGQGWRRTTLLPITIPNLKFIFCLILLFCCYRIANTQIIRKLRVVTTKFLVTTNPIFLCFLSFLLHFISQKLAN